MPTAHIPHTTRFPRFLTAAAATTAAALAATAPFANAADTTWGTDRTITEPTDISGGNLIIQSAAPGPVVNVTSPGELKVAGDVFVAGNLPASKGTLNITDGGEVTSTGDLRLANANDTEGTLNISGYGSSFDNGKDALIGFNGAGILNITDGGELTTTSNAHVYGKVPSKVTVTGKGSTWTLGAGIYLANAANGNATFDIAAGGTVNAPAQTTVAQGTNSTGTFNLYTGGTLATGVIKKGAGNGTLNLNGGTIKATIADQTNFFQDFGTLNLNATNLSAGAPAFIFDTNGHNVTSSDGGTTTFWGSGGLTKTGNGILSLTGVNTYTGTTTVAGGMLKVLGELNGGANHPGQIVLSNNGQIVFHQTDKQTFSGVLSGTGIIAFAAAPSVVVAGTGTLNPGAAGVAGTLTFANTTGVTLAAGARFVVDLVSLADGGSSLLVVEGGNLVLDGAQLVLRRGAKFPSWGAKGGSEIVIAKVITSGAEITGMFANVDEKQFVTDATGRRALVSVRANTDGGQDLLLTMFPEPSTYALLGGTGALLLALFRRRRQHKVATKAAK